MALGICPIICQLKFRTFLKLILCFRSLAWWKPVLSFGFGSLSLSHLHSLPSSSFLFFLFLSFSFRRLVSGVNCGQPGEGDELTSGPGSSNSEVLTICLPGSPEGALRYCPLAWISESGGGRRGCWEGAFAAADPSVWKSGDGVGEGKGTHVTRTPNLSPLCALFKLCFTQTLTLTTYL